MVPFRVYEWLVMNEDAGFTPRLLLEDNRRANGVTSGAARWCDLDAPRAGEDVGRGDVGRDRDAWVQRERERPRRADRDACQQCPVCATRRVFALQGNRDGAAGDGGDIDDNLDAAPIEVDLVSTGLDCGRGDGCDDGGGIDVASGSIDVRAVV